MLRKIFLLFFFIASTAQLTGCSLFGSDEEEADSATVSEESASDEDSEEADSEVEDPEEFADSDGTEEFQDEVGESDGDALGGDGGDEYPDDDYGGGSSDGEDFAFSETDSIAIDEGDSAPPEVEEEPLFDSNGEPQEEDLEVAQNGPLPDEPILESYGRPAPSLGYIPVKKMKTATYQRAGSKINRLYVARSGDTITSIGQKIYGSNKASDLYKWNSHFSGRTLKVGDKVYYASARNPSDNHMKTYYQELNIPPKSYSLNRGDNIRKVAKKLLGHSRSWMEIWATNPGLAEDEKGSISSSQQIQYWPDGAMAPAPIAKKPTPKPKPVAPPKPEPVEIAVVEEVPVEVEEMQEIEEVTEITDVSEVPIEEMGEFEDMGDIEELDNEEFNPPPTTAGTAGSPPPPAASGGGSDLMGGSMLGGVSDLTAGIGQDQTMMQMAMGVLVVLLGLILLILVRRNRAKAKKVKLTQTQV